MGYNIFMILTRRTTFRLYPTAIQEQKLYKWRRLHAYLFNAAISNRRTQYEKFGHSVDYFEQQNCLPVFKEVWTDYKALGSHALQATLKRVDMAYQRFFQGLGDYPKFKSIRHYSGWTYPDRAGWKAHTIGDNGYLELSNLGQIQMRGKAKIWGNPTTCTIVHRHGKWYASITINREPVSRELGTGSIGIDFGTNTAAAISDGENGYLLSNPRWLKQAMPKIKKASKDKRRKRAPNRKKKIKASRRWKHASKKVSQLQRKIACSRQNWVHHQAIQITSGNSMVASEKLEVKNMIRKAKPGSKRKQQKTGLNRSILDVGWGMLKGAIRYKLEEGGGVFVEVPTKKVAPSQTCPKCGDRKEKERGQRIHACQKCGYVQDRDLAAAEVMVLWARGVLPGFGTSLANVDVSSSTLSPKARKSCGGMRQLGQ
ncbi:MAG: transposase, partial [Chroococcidiopsidaceae cyanobacterium CP_BM_ER_R8_30]|nr:transposase [Chroococcidiopsidaceae cyanobacterium CP_BM_ER_R8_30]